MYPLDDYNRKSHQFVDFCAQNIVEFGEKRVLNTTWRLDQTRSARLLLRAETINHLVLWRYYVEITEFPTRNGSLNVFPSLFSNRCITIFAGKSISKSASRFSLKIDELLAYLLENKEWQTCFERAARFLTEFLHQLCWKLHFSDKAPIRMAW